MPSRLRRRILSAGLAVSLSGILPSFAVGQVRPVYGGNALDANYQVGSGGINQPVRTFVPNSTNLLITGNVSSGQAFRGFSPIRDPSQLFVGLPSSSLFDFRRDSVSVSDVVGGASQFQPQPFFAPERTVTNAGAIGARLNQPGSSLPLSSHALPRAAVWPTVPTLDASVTHPNSHEALLRPPPLIETWQPNGVTAAVEVEHFSAARMTQPSRIASMPSAALRFSAPVTGFARPSLTDTPIGRVDLRVDYRARDQAGSDDDELFSRNALESVLDPSGQDDPMRRPLDTRIENPLLDTRLIEPSLSLTEMPRTDVVGLDAVQAAEAFRGRDGQTIPVAPFPSRQHPAAEDSAQTDGRPGQPTLRDARLPSTSPTSTAVDPLGLVPSLGESISPVQVPPGDPLRDVIQPIPGSGSRAGESPPLYDRLPGTTRLLADPGALPETYQVWTPVTGLGGQEARLRQLRLVRLLDRPIRSFVLDETQLLDKHLREAETLLSRGDYYPAVSRYAFALDMDNHDPRPWLGKAHALIGAGDYLSAVYNLQRGIALVPQIRRFQLDLSAMLTHDDVLQQKRADLEQRLAGDLASFDRYQLQFLLGYIELYSGLAEFGRKNLEAAASQAPLGSMVRRFPALLSATEPAPSRQTQPGTAGPADDVP